MERYKYFLFGGEAINLYLALDLDDFIAYVKQTGIDFNTFIWDEELHNPEDILDEFVKWDAWYIIKKEEHDLLEKTLTFKIKEHGKSISRVLPRL